MKNADMPAMPLSDACIGEHAASAFASGLTKREHFAAMAMQGFLANSWQAKELDETGDTSGEQMSVVAATSVTIADALLAELERTQ